MASFDETLAWYAAVLVMKNMVVHLLVVRCRLATKMMNQKVTPENDPSNWKSITLFHVFARVLLANVGPYRTTNDLERFSAMEVNAAQNETYFLILALFWSQSSDVVPEWSERALTIYTLSRFAHFFLYAFVRTQPLRAISWTVGAVVIMSMCMNILGWI